MRNLTIINVGDFVETVRNGAVDSHYFGLWKVIAIEGDRVTVSKAIPDPEDWATEFGAYLDDIQPAPTWKIRKLNNA